ncbi:MAG: hypothetical protein JNL01_06020 [Bdellovibrionales bacterium]|nr:hypothetical protein [Bdellovibrionales bacterium]
MIVVAIIGILASIAIPNYQKYQARSRQTEAKISLAALYTAEQGYVVEASTYSMCLQNIGYQPTGNLIYYATGFDGAADTGLCGPTGATACNQYYSAGTATACAATGSATSAFQYDATAKVAQAAVLTASNTLAGTTMNQSTFTGQAKGNVTSSGAVYDTWTVNQQKTITNTVSGI